MPFGLCNATFERLMDCVLSGMRWSHCLVYLDDVISFGTDVPEAMLQLTEVLERWSSFGLQLEVKKCMFMQTEVAFLGHVVGRAGLACDMDKLSAVRAWHPPDSVKQVRQFVGFVGYYRWFIPNFLTGTAGGPDSKRDCIRVDCGKAGCVWRFEILSVTSSNIGLPYRIRPWSAAFWIRSRAIRSRDGIHQPESPAVTMPVLYHSPGDVGRRHDVHSLSFIPPCCSINLTHRSPEVPQ